MQLGELCGTGHPRLRHGYYHIYLDSEKRETLSEHTKIKKSQNYKFHKKGISQSPYLKVDLFSFNEVHIGPVEIKLRPMSSNPVKFFCRCCQSLCFEIQSANSTKNKCLTLQAFGHNSQQPPIKHANYIFHPTEPFAIRVGRIGIHERSTGDPYNDQRISFHFYKPL